MSIKTSDSFDAFASLHRYFAWIESSKPTSKQADEAIALLCQIYGASTEEELLQLGDSEITAAYQEMKHKILKEAALD
ncbi:hypothetical protein [Paenibacillus sp. SI8]|uniref:hypothetical protein n=1 Tax=unclassified Paenibacillus TaxID=185978 RepID=UPI003466E5CD